MEKKIVFGAHNEPNQKNEDRASMYKDHEVDGCPNISSFGVFDGHNGSLAASICAQHFNRRVVRRIKRLMDIPYSQDDISDDFSRQDQIDAIVCESIRLTALEIDANIQSSHHSGCTLNALFLLHDPDSGSTRVYCANIGDSRCVMFSPIESTIGGSVGSRRMDSSDALISTEHDSVKSNLSRKASRVIAYQMSEDHKLSLQRERTRIENQYECSSPSLPSDVVKGYIKLVNSSRGDIDEQGDFLTGGYPPNDTLQRAEMYIQKVCGLVDVTAKRVNYSPAQHSVMIAAVDKTSCSQGEHTQNEEEITATYQQSFIARRRLPGGEAVGPEAVFGRFNVSINMTRSVGDRVGPRCVIAVPDIGAVTVPINQFARFVVCSDGVWDVITTSDMRRMVLDYQNPEQTSVMVCEEAVAKRITRRIRMDDITTITIDVNPHAFKARTAGEVLSDGCCIIL